MRFYGDGRQAKTEPASWLIVEFNRQREDSVSCACVCVCAGGYMLATVWVDTRMHCAHQLRMMLQCSQDVRLGANTRESTEAIRKAVQLSQFLPIINRWSALYVSTLFIIICRSDTGPSPIYAYWRLQAGTEETHPEPLIRKSCANLCSSWS